LRINFNVEKTKFLRKDGGGIPFFKIGENQDDLEVTRKIKDVKNPDFAIK
jgi:hypothetical protein